MHWRNTILAMVAAPLLLAGCLSDTPLPTDAVRDSASAIAIADKACNSKGGWKGRWSARLSDGFWEAKLEGSHEYGKCNWIRTKVRASDGDVASCQECLTVE